MVRTWIFATIGLMALSCTDDPPLAPVAEQPPPAVSYDTIFPCDYLPAWPGSYWRYVDDALDTTEIASSPTWQLDHYQITGAAYVSDTVHVPNYDGVPLWCYVGHSGYFSNSSSTPMIPVLMDSVVGAEWGVMQWMGTCLGRKIIARDTTITIGATSYYPTIVVEQFYCAGPPTYTWTSRRYYTKYVGMVKEETSTMPGPVVHSRVLIDHFINH